MVEVGDELMAGAAWTEANVFWKSLTEEQLAYFIRVTEDIYFDRFSGLLHAYEKLHPRWPMIVVTILKTVLNVYMVLAFELFTDEKLQTRNSANQSVLSKIYMQKLMEHELRIEIIAWFEIVVVCGSALLYILLAMLVIFNKRLSWLVERFPVAFWLFPKVSSKFSTVSFLHVFDFSRTSVMLARGDWMLNAKLLKDVCNPVFQRNRDVDTVLQDLDVSKTIKRVWWQQRSSWITLFSLLFTMIVSFYGLIVKMSWVVFAAIVPETEWNLEQWILIIGFVNQLAAVYSDIWDMQRVFLFRYGGADSKWGGNEFAYAISFVHLLAQSLMRKGRTSVNTRLRVLAIIAGMNSDHLQQLMLSSRVKRRVSSFRQHRLEFYKEYYHRMRHEDTDDADDDLLSNSASSASEFLSAPSLTSRSDSQHGSRNIEAIIDRKRELIEIRDKLLKDRDMLGDVAWMRFGAEIQEHIEDLDEV